MYMKPSDFPQVEETLRATLREFLFEPNTTETEARLRETVQDRLAPFAIQVQVVQHEGSSLTLEVDAPLENGQFKAFTVTEGPETL